MAKLLLLLFAFISCYSLQAQDYTKLTPLNGYYTKAYYSTGAAVKAKRMAQQLDNVMDFYHQHLQFKPAVTLLILSPDDWGNFTKMPVYGMPHYTNSKTLIVAAEDNSYWKGMVPATDKMPEKVAGLIKDTYTNKSGVQTMEPFFDLLAIHELGHAYYNQDSLSSQRRWLTELFCNILLHTYIAEKEPQYLPALTAFPQMVVAATDKATFKYTTLQELETNYNDIGPNYPENYGWYQCRWHVAAGKIYDATKLEGIKKLYAALNTKNKKLDDKELAVLLQTKVHTTIADVMLKWDSGDL